MRIFLLATILFLSKSSCCILYTLQSHVTCKCQLVTKMKLLVPKCPFTQVSSVQSCLLKIKINSILVTPVYISLHIHLHFTSVYFSSVYISFFVFVLVVEETSNRQQQFKQKICFLYT